jgi:hypothetical protein
MQIRSKAIVTLASIEDEIEQNSLNTTSEVYYEFKKYSKSFWISFISKKIYLNIFSSISILSNSTLTLKDDSTHYFCTNYRMPSN